MQTSQHIYSSSLSLQQTHQKPIAFSNQAVKLVHQSHMLNVTLCEL